MTIEPAPTPALETHGLWPTLKAHFPLAWTEFCTEFRVREVIEGVFEVQHPSGPKSFDERDLYEYFDARNLTVTIQLLKQATMRRFEGCIVKTLPDGLLSVYYTKTVNIAEPNARRNIETNTFYHAFMLRQSVLEQATEENSL